MVTHLVIGILYILTKHGDYVVILTITDNNGNSDEFQQNVSLSLPNVDEPPVDETTEDTEDTIIEESTDEETSYEDDTEEEQLRQQETTTEQQTLQNQCIKLPMKIGFNPQMGMSNGYFSPEGQWIWNGCWFESK